MWNAKDFLKIAIKDGEGIGYIFKCPKCDETLDMLFRTLPYSDEFRKACIEKYKYDPQAVVWDKEGDLDSGDLTLSPSIVHMGCDYGGHYWVRDGKIINC